MTDADLGQALPLPVRFDEGLRRLSVRRSAPAQALLAPGPNEAELNQLLSLAARTPDHGKLFPWRFVVLGPAARAGIAEALLPMAARQPDPGKAAKVLAKLTAPPLTVLVVSAPVASRKVPVWEQELSAGAVCMTLEHAADALGYSASWITDWYSYDAEAVALFGIGPGERIAGFIHLGTLAEPPQERPRPDLSLKIERRD